MIEQRRVILEYLKTLHPRVWYDGEAPNKAVLPYVTFAFQTSQTPDESKLTRLVDVDIWDIPPDGDSTRIEELAVTIKGDGNILATPTGFDEQSLGNEAITLLSRFSNDDYVENNDKTVKHILQIYEVTVLERSSE